MPRTSTDSRRTRRSSQTTRSNALATPLLDIVLGLTGGLLNLLLEDLADEVEGTLVGVVDAVLKPLEPVLDGVLSQIVRITINEQPTAAPINATGGDLGPGSFTVRALAVDLLPVLGPAAVELDLASASVRTTQAEAEVAASPDPVRVGDELTTTGAGFAPGAEVTVTCVDADGVTVARHAVTTDELGGFTDVLVAPRGTALGAMTVGATDGPGSATTTAEVLEADGGGAEGGDTDGADPSGGDADGGDPTGGSPEGGDPVGGNPEGADPDGDDPTGADADSGDVDGDGPDGTDPSGDDSEGTDPDGTDLDGADPDGTDPEGTDPGAATRTGSPAPSTPSWWPTRRRCARATS